MVFSFAPSNNHTNNINNGNNNNISHQHHYASYADMASHSTGTSHISSSVGSNATQLNMFTMVAMDASNDEHAKVYFNMIDFLSVNSIFYSFQSILIIVHAAIFARQEE